MKRKIDQLNEYEENLKVDQTPSHTPYTRDDVNRFQSIKDLRNKVKSNTDVAFRELISDHTYVGSIDREFSLIQHSTSLYVANTPAISRQLFYQIILADFGNFNAIRLNPPVSISSLAKLALDDTGTFSYLGSLHIWWYISTLILPSATNFAITLSRV